MNQASVVSSRLSEKAEINNFQALKELKEADREFDTIANRIKVMQLNESKNMKRLENDQMHIQKLVQVR